MTRVGWGNICGKLWPASQISASKQRTGYPASTAGGYPVGPRGPDICVGVLARYPTQKTARYPTQKRDQISVNCTQADIRQLHAGRYPSGTHRQISVNCTQEDIRQLHTARYPSAAHSQISVSCTQPDIWERDGDRYLALRADQIPPDTNQISGSCGDDPTQWRPQISGICATGYLAWARRKDEDFFDQPDIWWYANQRREGLVR